MDVFECIVLLDLYDGDRLVRRDYRRRLRVLRRDIVGVSEYVGISGKVLVGRCILHCVTLGDLVVLGKFRDISVILDSTRVFGYNKEV